MKQYDTSLNDYLKSSFHNFPKNIALVSREYKLTYSDIYDYVIRLSSYFNFLGVRKGDRIIISLGNSVFSIIAFWASLRLGAIVSLIHPKTSRDQFDYILKEVNPTILLCLKGQIKTVFPGVQVICFESDSWNPSYFETIPYVESPECPSLLDIDLACIIYTSGSTGEPKGVMLSHRNMLSASISINRYLHYQADDRILCVLPISFDYGLYQMILSFSVGACLILEKDFNFPLKTLKLISKEKSTIFPLVSPMISVLYDHHRRFAYDLNSIRSVTNTGSALNVKHIEMLNNIFPSAQIYAMYGLTECKRCTYLPPEKLREKPTSVGLPIPNSELWVVDENGVRLGPNKMGEIVVRGAAVMQGYWNKPDKTAVKLRPGFCIGDKILYTGDFGFLDEEGFLYLHGRKDEILKSRGIKVSPFEIEHALLKIPSIKEAVVIGFEDDLLEPVILACIIKDDSLTINEIRLLCRDFLSSEKIPHYFKVFSNFPRNSNGKIDKSLMKNQYIQDRESI